jgi:FAD/FMN-containing dehydrogenase
MPLPDVEATLIFNLEGSAVTVEEELAEVARCCKEAGAIDVKTAATQEEADLLWAGRRSLASAMFMLDPRKAAPNIAGDYGVPIGRIPELIKEVRKVVEESGISLITFGHVGDGNLHSHVAVNLLDEEEVARALKVGDAIYEIALKLGGTTLPEHGVGGSKVRWLKRESKSAYPLMLALKKMFDPQNIMNPGKIVEI